MSPWNLHTGQWQPMEGSKMVAGQASNLHRIIRPKPVQVVAVTSGKGGVGKTSVAVNLGIAMAREGKRVMLMDADLGLANVDVHLGLQTGANLSHVLAGHCSLEEVIIEGPAGVKIIPASSGVQHMTELTANEHAGLINAFSELGMELDVLLIDTAAGVSGSVMSFARAAQEIMVVVCDEPASITDAYALIKLLNREHGQQRFHILANMVRDFTEGRDLFKKLLRVTDRFLDVTLDFIGTVPQDDLLRKSIQKQCAVVEAYPRSRAATAFKKLAINAQKWPKPNGARGHLEFFIERLVRTDDPYPLEAKS